LAILFAAQTRVLAEMISVAVRGVLAIFNKFTDSRSRALWREPL
jgi:hypothetical protein